MHPPRRTRRRPRRRRAGPRRHHRDGMREGMRGGGRVFGHGGLRFVLLQLIADKPSHGYELIKAIEDRLGGSYSPSPGTVYPTLTLLEELGYLTRGRRPMPAAASATASPTAGQDFLAENRVTTDAMLARMQGGVDGAGPRGGRPPQVTRAIENLKLAMRMRLSREPLTPSASQRLRRRARQRGPATGTDLTMHDTDTLDPSLHPRPHCRTACATRCAFAGSKSARCSASRRTWCASRSAAMTLEGFTSPGFDDHVKLIFPDAATGVLTLPTIGADGSRSGRPAPRPTMRDYTPRRFDAEARHAGDRLRAARGRPRHALGRAGASRATSIGIGGPRGSFIVPIDFDWHLLVGDDTALPAIARRLAELPAGARALVLAEVDGAGRPHRAARAGPRSTCVWVHRDDAAPNPAEPPLLDCAAQRAPARRATSTAGWAASPPPPRPCARTWSTSAAPIRSGSARRATGAGAPPPRTIRTTNKGAVRREAPRARTVRLLMGAVFSALHDSKALPAFSPLSAALRPAAPAAGARFGLRISSSSGIAASVITIMIAEVVQVADQRALPRDLGVEQRQAAEGVGVHHRRQAGQAQVARAPRWPRAAHAPRSSLRSAAPARSRCRRCCRCCAAG